MALKQGKAFVLNLLVAILRQTRRAMVNRSFQEFERKLNNHYSQIQYLIEFFGSSFSFDLTPI